MKIIWIHKTYPEFKNNCMGFDHWPYYCILLIVVLTKILDICKFDRESDFIQIVMILFAMTIYFDIIEWKKNHLKAKFFLSFIGPP